LDAISASPVGPGEPATCCAFLSSRYPWSRQQYLFWWMARSTTLLQD